MLIPKILFSTIYFFVVGSVIGFVGGLIVRRKVKIK